MKYSDARPVGNEIPYSSRRAYAAVVPTENENARVLVNSKAAYIQDPVTGAWKRIGKPANKHERRKAMKGVKV